MKCHPRGAESAFRFLMSLAWERYGQLSSWLRNWSCATCPTLWLAYILSLIMPNKQWLPTLYSDPACHVGLINGRSHGCDKIPESFGHQKLATTGLVHSKSSSFEPFWPVDVQRRGHLPRVGIMGVPMAMIRAPGILQMPELSNHWHDWADSPGWFSPNEVHWNRGIWMYSEKSKTSWYWSVLLLNVPWYGYVSPNPDLFYCITPLCMRHWCKP